MSYRLVVEKGRSKGNTLTLAAGSFVVGRDQGSSLVVNDPQVSRKHFRVEQTDGAFVIHDEGSSNGTWVNGERIDHKTLFPGDKVLVGDSIVYFLEEETTEPGKKPKERRGPLSGREITGYRMGRLLGRGGMGTVYEALQVSLERKVAFKVLSPELARDQQFIDRFISEARAAGRLSHANIVAVYDVGQHEDLRFYSMEYMSGGSVEDLLRKAGPLEVARTIPLVFDAARGLEFAEKHRVIHRDIKPDNLMIGTDDVVKICDLGIATFHQPGAPTEVSGSPHYLAPEHALGKEIDHRVDLYSLGVTWYQMLTGDTPFDGSSPREIVMKHINETPPSLREKGVPDDVATVVEQLMTKDPAERTPSARQLQAELVELARRYPLRETIMLRLDAMAPEGVEANLVALEEEAYEEEPALSWLTILGVAAVLLLVGFLVTSVVVGPGEDPADTRKAAKLRAEAEDDVALIRERVANRDWDLAIQYGESTAERLAEAGYEDLVAEANQLVEEARDGRIEQREDEAGTQLRDLKDVMTKVVGPGPVAADPETLGRLDTLLGELKALAERYAGTKAAAESVSLHEQVRATRADVERQIAERQRLETEAREAFTRAEETIQRILGQPRQEPDNPSRFQEAYSYVEAFQEDHQDVVPKLAKDLAEQVRLRAQRTIDRTVKESLRLAGQNDFSGARAELATYRNRLSPFPELQALVEKTEQQIDQVEVSARKAQVAERQRAARERAQGILEAIAPLLAARSFADAADRIELDKNQISRRDAPEVLQDLEARAGRLRRAGKAMQRFVKELQAGRLELKLTLNFPGVGEDRAEFDSVERRAGKPLRLVFRAASARGVLTDLEIPELEAKPLLEALLALEVQSDPSKLDVAALAFELGDRERARDLCIQLSSKPTMREAARALLASFEQE